MEELISTKTAGTNGAAQNTPSEANATTDVPVTRLEYLQKLLRGLLPNIKRWNSVDVYYYKDNLPKCIKESYKKRAGNVYIHFNGIKGKNIHPFITIEIEASRIEEVINDPHRLIAIAEFYKY
jgi:hypothetical protein